MEKDCNVPALLKEASYFGLQGLEAALQEVAKEKAQVGTGDEFLLNVGGEIFVTSKDTLCWMTDSKLARMVRGEEKQEFDKDGNLFIDCDPKDFAYVLKILRKRGRGHNGVTKEAFNDVRATAELNGRGRLASRQWPTCSQTCLQE